MNEQDRNLIQQVLQSAGTAGEKGFGYLVQYAVVDAYTTVIGSAITCIGVGMLMRYLWKEMPKESRDWRNDDDYAPAKFIGSGISLIALVIAGCLFFSGIATALAPQGAAIHSALEAMKSKCR